MEHGTETLKAGELYAAAQAAHYETKSLREALGLYGNIVATLPHSQEARYSRSQIENIVKAVVPDQEILAMLVRLAWDHLRQQGHNEAVPVSLPEALLSPGLEGTAPSANKA